MKGRVPSFAATLPQVPAAVSSKPSGVCDSSGSAAGSKPESAPPKRKKKNETHDEGEKDEPAGSKAKKTKKTAGHATGGDLP